MLRKLYLLFATILISVVAFAQTGTLKGTVLDALSGEAVPFANVIIERNGTQTAGTTTDFDDSITSSDYFGVFCKYTVTRSKKFWFDDFNVSASNMQSIVYTVIPTGTTTTIDANGTILNAFPATETYVLGDTVSLVPTISPLYYFSHWETDSNSIVPNTSTEQISFYANYSDTIQLHTLLIPATTAFIYGNDTICYNQNIDAEIGIAFTGIPPFTFVYAIDGISQPACSTSLNPYIILTQQGGIYTLDSFNDTNGAGTTAGSGMVFVNTSPIDCPPPSAIEEHFTNKELLRTIDVLGRETKGTNQPLFYIYDDGTIGK